MSPAARSRPARAKPAAGRSSRGTGRGAPAARRKATRSSTATRRRPAAARRGRLLLSASALGALVVMLTGMPVSALLTQHRQLATTAAELTQLQDADRTLAAQARALADSSTVSGLARSEYGLVPSGQKAYVVLPPSGATAAQVAGSGHVPLEGPPVVPGSAQSEALLGLSTATTPATSASGPAPGAHRTAANGHGSAGFWARVLRTLEFWR